MITDHIGPALTVFPYKKRSLPNLNTSGIKLVEAYLRNLPEILKVNKRQEGKVYMRY